MVRRPSLSPELPAPRRSAFVPRRGFTLVEAIVVIIIIAVLATLIAPRLIGRVGDTKQSVAKQQAAVLAGQMRLYIADAGTPPADASIQVLWERPGEVDASKWKGPYVESADKLNDPWGKAYVLIVPGQKNVDFDVVSYGADGKPGGEGENADVIAP